MFGNKTDRVNVDLTDFLQEQSFGGHMDKVYIVSWNGTSIAGGVERVVKYIEDVLSAKYEVIIVCDNLLKKSRKWGRWIVKNATIKALGYSFYIAAHKKKGDYVISNGFQAPFIRAEYLWLHGNALEFHRCVGKHDYYKATKGSIMELIGAHRSRNAICVASHVKKEYEKLYHVSPQKMQVLSNPVDCTRFYPKAERTEQPDTITILYMGRLETGKGIKELLRLSSYIETLHGYRLMIVTQSERDRTRLFSNRQHTEVYCKVPIEKLNDYYNRSDVFYLPSRYEGFEMVTLESLSAGVPVVGYRVGAINELSRKGRQGVYILRDVTVETAFAQLTRAALKYKSREKRDCLYREVKQEYGIEVFEEKIKNIIGLL